MKPTGIAPIITPRYTDEFAERYNKLWNYLRPDGLNAVIEPIKKVKTQLPITTQHVYFKPSESITTATKSEGVGEIIDFRFG